MDQDRNKLEKDKEKTALLLFAFHALTIISEAKITRKIKEIVQKSCSELDCCQ